MRPQPEASFEGFRVSTSELSHCSQVNIEAFLMKRRKTVSVTPAMGASTVAGAMRTQPMHNSAGTLAVAGMVRALLTAPSMSPSCP